LERKKQTDNPNKDDSEKHAQEFGKTVRITEDGRHHLFASEKPKQVPTPLQMSPSKTLQQTEEEFREQTLSPALLLEKLEEMMMSRRKREHSLIDAAAANANAHAAPASTAERFNCDGGA
jgi:hypothetical protein